MARIPEKIGTNIVTRDRVDAVIDSVRTLTAREILVGIPSSTSARSPEDGAEEPPTNAELGYIHEYGAPANNIPPRPFLIPGVQSVTEAVADRLKRAAQAALKEDAGIVDAQMNAAGLIAQNAVRAKITDGPFVPLSPRTIEARRSRKPPRTGTKPLLDTGQLRRSITYVIRDTDDDAVS